MDLTCVAGEAGGPGGAAAARRASEAAASCVACAARGSRDTCSAMIAELSIAVFGCPCSITAALVCKAIIESCTCHRTWVADG